MMAKQRKTIGTGITAREVVTYDGEDMLLAMTEFFSQWNANRKKGGGDYGAASLHIIEKCQRIIANSGGPYETGSPADFPERIIHETDDPADFAERILRHHQIAQAAIKRGGRDADIAARFALHVGLLAAQAIMKTVWERHALRGKNNLEAIKYGSKKTNQQRHQEREKEHQRWNAEAARIWTRSPHLSKRRVADMVQGELVLPDEIDTIARNLKKPGMAR
jgi:hypothetical protein